jgi:PAS domain S-box-containing protein
MLVEDEKVVAADIEECVKALGYEITGSATSGPEALRLAERLRPDLVLMDIKLRGPMDGIEVAASLYEHYQIPVVYLTAHADAEILERAKRTAPSGYVLKPFDERTLHTAIEMAFDRHRRERALIESGQRLATAIGSIDEAVIVTQENGQIAVMNRLAEHLTGWKQEEALGKSIAEVFTILNPKTGAPQASLAGRVLREGISIGLGEGLLFSRQGVRSPIQGSASPVRDGNADPVGVCLLFRAANQRSHDEDWGAPEHSSASRMEILGYLAAAVARKFTKLLQADEGRARAVRLANRLLEFGQRQPSLPADVNLNDLAGGLEDLLQCTLGDDIELDMVLGPAVQRAKGDPGQVELLLMNLAINARRAAVPGAFLVETSVADSDGAGDTYAVIAVRPPQGSTNAADLPALDEILRQSPGEMRVSSEGGLIQIYLPASKRLPARHVN